MISMASGLWSFDEKYKEPSGNRPRLPLVIEIWKWHCGPSLFCLNKNFYLSQWYSDESDSADIATDVIFQNVWTLKYILCIWISESLDLSCYYLIRKCVFWQSGQVFFSNIYCPIIHITIFHFPSLPYLKCYYNDHYLYIYFKSQIYVFLFFFIYIQILD